MKKQCLSTVVLCLILIALGATPIGAQEPIKIGMVSAYTGPAAYDGTSTLIAGRVAANEINAAGGVLGRKIESIAGDSRAIPAEAVKFDERQQAIPKIHVALVIGGKRVVVEEIDTKGLSY